MNNWSGNPQQSINWRNNVVGMIEVNGILGSSKVAVGRVNQEETTADSLSRSEAQSPVGIVELVAEKDGKKTEVGKMVVSVVSDNIGKGLKGDLQETLGKEFFKVDFIVHEKLDFSALMDEVEKCEMNGKLGKVVVLLGGSQDVHHDFEKLYSRLDVSELNCWKIRNW